ncbi:MAG: hypothetical protein QGF36_03670 [Candidatus Marinimicrobia bacterium]|nr:hypothetical protein [Candidatus Neomarinimicrobiota bacterium]MDP6853393.1 hypothetical protein [Candidatus Neomarinimicrobiota bacterium]MDP6936513.1 hypothetical protein [Candidatus Neomarinimicrobiota bacterium]
MNHFRFVTIIFSLVPAMIWGCPYCAGQSGETYIQSIIVPIGSLLLAPFCILGLVGCIIYFNSKSNEANESTH